MSLSNDPLVNMVHIEGKIVDSIQGSFTSQKNTNSNEYNFNLKSYNNLFNVRFVIWAGYLETHDIKNNSFVYVSGRLKEDHGDVIIIADSVTLRVKEVARTIINMADDDDHVNNYTSV